MSWKAALYGSEETSTIKIIGYKFISLILLLAAYGWWADFVPSSEWAETAFNLAIAATTIFLSIYYLALSTGRAKFKPEISTSHKVLIISLLPIMVFTASLIAITHGLGDIATQTFGREIKLTVELVKGQRKSRKLCDYFLEGHAIDKALPNHMCISKVEFKTFPKIGEYVLQAKQTQLGTHIKSYLPPVNR